MSSYYTSAVVQIQVETPVIISTLKEDVKYHLNSLGGSRFRESRVSATRWLHCLTIDQYSSS